MSVNPQTYPPDDTAQAPIAGPEDEPIDSDSQGEEEEDAPERVSGDAATVGERIRDAAERDAAAAEAEESESPPMPQHDPRTRQCPICNGWGRLLTGSMIEAHEDRVCWNCTGMGFEEAVRSAPGSPVTFPAVSDTPAENPSGWDWPSQAKG